MALKIQVFAWDRHNNVEGLNRLNTFWYSRFCLAFILPFVIESSGKIFSTTFLFAEFESSARDEGKFVLCQMLMGICLYKSELNQIGIFSDFFYW